MNFYFKCFKTIFFSENKKLNTSCLGHAILLKIIFEPREI